MQANKHRSALPKGEKIHWYAIERVLGQGGFGITYLAHDTNLNQQVAIKEFLPTDIAVRTEDTSVQPRSSDDEEIYKWGLSRFQEEARTLARYDHPNIVRVHSIFEKNHTAYIVMRYEEGESLRDIIKRKKHLTEQELLGIVLPILNGLDMVHESGFIHRDIKPANIYIRKDSSPVLLDFGAARQTIGEARTLTILVAPGYAPIEQYYSDGGQQGPWTDVYAIGATLYRAVAGVKPIDAIERSRGMLGSTRDILVPAKVAGQGRYSDGFLDAIDHALKFNEQDRPQSAAEFASELRDDLHDDIKAEIKIKKSTATHLSSDSDNDSESITEHSFQVPDLSKSRLFRWGGIATVFIVGIGLGMYALQQFQEDEKVVTATTAQINKVQEPITTIQTREGSTPTIDETTDVTVTMSQTQDADLLAEIEEKMEAEKTARLEAEAKAEEETKAKLQAEAKAEQDTKARLDAVAKAEKEVKARLDAVAKAEEEIKARAEAELKAMAEKKAKVNAETKDRAAAKARLQEMTVIKPEEKPEPAPEATKKPNNLQVALDAMTDGNYPHAITLLRPLAENGNPAAQFNIARLYHEGRGVLANNNVALNWMRQAAWQGSTDAQIALARMYVNGIDGVLDVFLAYTWFLVAERNGVYSVAVERNEIEDKLQAEQIPQAAALAAELYRLGTEGDNN